MEFLKNKKFIIAAVSVMALVLAVLFFIRKKKNDEASSSFPTGALTTEHPNASFPLTPYSKAGEYSTAAGSYGQQIANLQKICNDKFGKNLAVDGKLGPKTEAAFNSCFGSPLVMPYSEEVYNGLMLQHGGGLGLA